MKNCSGSQSSGLSAADARANESFTVLFLAHTRLTYRTFLHSAPCSSSSLLSSTLPLHSSSESACPGTYVNKSHSPNYFAIYLQLSRIVWNMAICIIMTEECGGGGRGSDDSALQRRGGKRGGKVGVGALTKVCPPALFGSGGNILTPWNTLCRALIKDLIPTGFKIRPRRSRHQWTCVSTVIGSHSMVEATAIITKAKDKVKETFFCPLEGNLSWASAPLKAHKH